MCRPSEGVCPHSSSWAHGWLYIGAPVITVSPNSRNIRVRYTEGAFMKVPPMTASSAALILAVIALALGIIGIVGS